MEVKKHPVMMRKRSYMMIPGIQQIPVEVNRLVVSSNRCECVLKCCKSKLVDSLVNLIQIISPLYSRYNVEACNELRGPSPLLSIWSTQFRRNVAAMASRWLHCVRFDRPRNGIQAFRSDSCHYIATARRKLCKIAFNLCLALNLS